MGNVSGQFFYDIWQRSEIDIFFTICDLKLIDFHNYFDLI